jgi:transglutaminase-like putative cysteine protease
MNRRLTVAAGLATVLASIALYPLLAGGTWFWGGIGAVFVVAAIGALTRRRIVPAGICLLAALAGVFLYLNALFAHRQSWLGLVPTGASLHRLRLLVMQAHVEIHHSTPPVPLRTGVDLLAVAGIGLVAALTDLLGVRLHRPAIAGLPLLVLFCVPLTTAVKPGAVGTALVFCAGMAGYLGLLSADGRYRLRLWGTVVHPWQGEPETAGPDTAPLAAAARRIGSAAVVLALFLPLLVPTARADRLFAGPGGGSGGGGQGPAGQVSLPKPLDLLNTDLHDAHPQVVLTYRLTGLGSPQYLQLYVLDHVTTTGWTMAAHSASTALGSGGIMPHAQGLTAGNPGLGVHETISLASSLGNSGNASYLLLPYPVRQVKVPGNWRVDSGSLMVHSTGTPLAGLHYIVTSRDITPTAQEERYAGPLPAGMTAYTSVPPAFDRLKSLADRLTAGQASPFEKAVALEAWFHRPGNFRYSLSADSGTGAAALARFLTKAKSGSCQQFAFGMAVLARLVGIPSRVVIGFTQGTVGQHNTWVVRTSDAHAWPQLYFKGVGWLNFEPTPPNVFGPAGQGTATVPAYTEPQQAPGGNVAPRTGQQQTNPGQAQHGGGSSAKLPGKLTSPLGGRNPTRAAQRHDQAPLWALAIVLLAALLLTPGVTRVLMRRLRWRRARDDVARAHVAWRELCDDLADHRITRQASESPRALASRLAEMLGLSGTERAALVRIARAEERASYAASPADSAQLRTDTALVRRAVRRAASPPARWSARVAPASVLAPARTGLRHALDAFGWIELATTKARAFIQRRTPRPNVT